MTLIGGSGDSGNPATGQGSTGNPAGGQGTGSGAGTPPAPKLDGAQTSWRDSLPDDLKAAPALQSFSDVPNLAKAFLHAQSQIGKKGVILPGEKATDEDWTQFFRQAGLPEKLDDYKVETPKDVQVNQELVSKFKETAHKLGMLPKQAQGFLDWYMGYEKEVGAKRVAEAKLASEESVKGLQKEWGAAFEQNTKAINAVVGQVGGEEFMKYLTKTGLGNDVPLIKFFHSVTKALGEDKLKGDGSGKLGDTPADIQAKIDAVRGDPKHPYFDKSHPGHANALKIMEGWYQKIAG
jgi:hypothetical protein